eukprot:2161615-Pleurochrysis_carterae.AAC.1
MVETKIAMVQACDDGRLLLVVAGALSSQEVQERVGAEYCIALLGRASRNEGIFNGEGDPAMLRLPASSDGGDELVMPQTGDGVESREWRQRAGATA